MKKILNWQTYSIILLTNYSRIKTHFNFNFDDISHFTFRPGCMYDCDVQCLACAVTGHWGRKWWLSSPCYQGPGYHMSQHSSAPIG